MIGLIFAYIWIGCGIAALAISLAAKVIDDTDPVAVGFAAAILGLSGPLGLLLVLAALL